MHQIGDKTVRFQKSCTNRTTLILITVKIHFSKSIIAIKCWTSATSCMMCGRAGNQKSWQTSLMAGFRGVIDTETGSDLSTCEPDDLDAINESWLRTWQVIITCPQSPRDYLYPARSVLCPGHEGLWRSQIRHEQWADADRSIHDNT